MLLESLVLKNVLSFRELELRLGPLNVLIGPNASGKSNFVDSIDLLRSTARDLQAAIRRGGGIVEWIRKGGDSKSCEIRAEVAIEGFASERRDTLHELHLIAHGASAQVAYEQIWVSRGVQESVQLVHDSFLYSAPNSPGSRSKEESESVLPRAYSILSKLRDPVHHSELTELGDIYRTIRIYREWSFGRRSVLREPQRADLPNRELEEDFSNLGLVLNFIRQNPPKKRELLERLRDLYDGITDFDVSIEGGTVQVFFLEGDTKIPAVRLSDGTLRYLCLLVILCHPQPPPLVCIEEPELGLHPDILPGVARLLKEASQRMQLIVTTHSDIIIDELSDQPESVLVCEKGESGTTIKRLEAEALEHWLKDYRLGQLWMKGQLGGTRW